MSLPRFLERAIDATAPVLGGIDRQVVRAKLVSSSVGLVGGEHAATGPSRAGYLLAANLLARLYPCIRLDGPEGLRRAAEAEILLINPSAEVTRGGEPTTASLGYEVEGDADVAVFARGWNVYIDSLGSDASGLTAAAAAFAAAAIGVAEVFRLVFADELGERGRRAPQPGGFNIVTWGEPRSDLGVPEAIEIERFRLVGIGAVGQAAAQTLVASGAHGTLLAIDPERIALSNLQRYVLTRDSDVGSVKVDLLRERLAESALDVIPIASAWAAGLVEDQLPTLVALDSPGDRIAVQSSLPGPIYNAWTQPADVGWSRHERFGDEPCLACLYWPERSRPNRHEQIATAFNQHPLRVLAYLIHRLPIGLPLPAGGIPAVPGLDAPADVARWLIAPLSDDIAAAAGLDPLDLAAWRDRPLADVYQDGICGGALLHLNVGEAPREVLVPLAHQSVLAGVMLASQLLVAQVPALARLRPHAIEGRYDVLAGMPQVVPRPRTRTTKCLCGDAVFRAVYRAKLGSSSRTVESLGVEGE